jgi:hypothetical protein|tara:strand:+ start:955 stop:1533 length:579 start_codon:yes stop_codon:yes gene_type:complete
MANEITKLLPFRQYDDNDVINMFAYEGTNVGAGTVVKVSAANLDNDLIDLVDGGSAFLTSQGNAYSPLAVNPLRVASAASGNSAIGILLRDVRETDENGEKLRFYPQKKEELQCVLSGETVPVATKGTFTLLEGAFSGSLLPAPAAELGLRANGLLATAVAADTVVGKVLATGSRAAGDTHAGGYAIVSINF